MNIQKTIETALSTLMKDYEVGAKTVIRCWHILQSDFRWVPDIDYTMPCIDVRCAGPKTDAGGVTLSATVSILIATKTDDDRDHTHISNIEQAVQECLDNLYAQYMAGSGEELTQFVSALAADCPVVSLGGFEFGDPLSPYDDAGLNVTGITFTVHYSRSDF